VDPGLELHVILDNYATHKHEKVGQWLKRHPRSHLHFISTGASWLNMVERLFGELDQKQLEWLASNSVAELVATVMRSLDNRNADLKPFVWTKGAQEIIDTIERGLNTLRTVH
jgi:hypothetical protein